MKAPSRLVLFIASGALMGTAFSAFGQTSFNWVGGPDGTSRALFDESSWDPALVAGTWSGGTSPTLTFATRNNGSSEDVIGGGLPLGVDVGTTSVSSYPRFGHLIFDDTHGHFPANLIIAGNQTGTTARFFVVEEPNTTFITLTENTTGTVSLGYQRATYGNLGIRLPATGISTIHVAHPAATLDLRGLFDNITGRGGLSGGAATYTEGQHAILRKTGEGTLDLRTEDGQGNRVGGMIIEGGTVIISSTLQLGWAPPAESNPVPDMVVINGGTLRTTNTGFLANSSLRGFQVGENGGTIEITGASLRLSNTFADVPGQAGVLIKTGTGVLGLQNATEGATHSGGTLLQQGQIHLVLGTASLGSAGGLGVTASTGTTLRGTGGINGNSTFADGAILRPDTLSAATVVDQPIGMFTFNHNVTFGAVSLIYDLGAPGMSDLIHVAGVLDIGFGLLDLASFTFTTGADFEVGIYTLLSSDSAIVGSLGENLTGQLSSLLGDFSVELGMNSGGDAILLTVIPEPSTYAMLFAGLAAFVVVRRFRRA